MAEVRALDDSGAAGSGNAQVRSVLRALDLMELLASEGTVSMPGAAQRLSVPRSSTHALLTTLLARGYVAYDAATRKYGIGLKAWETGQAFKPVNELIRAATPVMERLVEELDEICQLAVRDGQMLVYIHKVDCRQPIQLISRVGGRLYCHATALGKALLAGLSDPELDALYDGQTDLPQFTGRTISSPLALKDYLHRVRQEGFSEDEAEYVEGLRCIAVPIRDSAGNTIAAMSLSAPIGRVTPEWLDRAKSLLPAAAEEVATRLGSRPRDPARA